MLRSRCETADPALTPEYVKLPNQFVVPVMAKGKVGAMVILSLSLEVEQGTTQEVYEIEPKLRDVLLQVMFDHANSGGFTGAYTDGANLMLSAQGPAGGGQSGLARKMSATC